jgi:hypothetical protein
MRGSPPLHLVLFAVGFALLAIPLAQLTFARPERQAATQVEKASTATPTLIRLRFAHAPKSVSLKQHDGPELLSGTSGPPGAEIEARGDLRISEDTIELLLDVTWPEGTPDTAVTVDLEPDEKELQGQTRWSTGARLEEVLSYQWKP